MENGVYTYGDLQERLKNEKIKLELCDNTVLEVNGLTFATVNKIEIYKRKIGDDNNNTYVIIIDFLNDNNMIARKVLSKEEKIKLQNRIIKYEVVIER